MTKLSYKEAKRQKLRGIKQDLDILGPGLIQPRMNKWPPVTDAEVIEYCFPFYKFF